jgi:hypothetical protein
MRIHSKGGAVLARVAAGMALTLAAGVALTLAAAAAPAVATSGSSDAYTFVSAPDLHPPKLQLLDHKHGLAPGDFLVTAQGNIRVHGTNPNQGGPLMLDDRLQPIWFRPENGGLLVFRQETYEGHPVLVWVQGGTAMGRSPHRKHPTGPTVVRTGGQKVVVVNEHYRTVAKLQARAPWTIDAHDVSIVGRDVWVPVDRAVAHQNLTPYGGPKSGTVIDVGIQEYRLSTGKLLRTWDPLNPGGKARVPLSASHERASSVWDAYHLNSVQPLPDGDVLVSMRNTSAVYLINPRTDRIVWTLGGRSSTFKVAKDARFGWQHDAQLVHPRRGGLGPDVELTLFDDNSGRGPARGLVLRLNTHTQQAKLVAAYRHHPELVAGAEGSMQLLPNGNVLVGWGSPSAEFTEFSKSGRQLLDAAFPLREQSYRALLTDTWVGTPYYPPSGAVRGTTVYASWNGATEVAKWEVLAGSSTTDLRVVATRSRTGFETAVKLAHTYADYEVRALAANGRTLGTSKPFS